jgi:hypothetical protein
MQPFECRMLELFEAGRNEATELRQHAAHASIESNVEAVGNQMPATEALGIRDQLIERQANRSVVRSNDRPGTRPHDDVDGNFVGNEALKHTNMACAAQPSAAEHERGANGRFPVFGQRVISQSRVIRVKWVSIGAVQISRRQQCVIGS